MTYLTTRRSLIFSAFLYALLAAAIQTTPIVTSQSTLGHGRQYEPSFTLVGRLEGDRYLMKRAVGGIPISSSFSDATTRLEVTKRAVGSVADSGKVCDPIMPLKLTSKLHARSRPYRTTPPVKSLNAKKTAPPPAISHSSKPEADYKYSRGAAW